MKEKIKTSSGDRITIIIVSFFLAAVVVFLSILAVAGVTLFNDREIITKVSQTTYSSQLNKDIALSCHSVTDKYGLDYAVVAEVITPSSIETDMSVYFNSISSENPEAAEDTIDTQKLKDKLYNAFLAGDKEINPIVAEKVASLIAEEYKETLVLKHLENFYKFADDQKKIIEYAFIFLSILFIVLAYLLIRMNKGRRKHRLLRRFSVVFCSSGLTIVVLSIAIKLSEVLERIAFYESEREYNIFMKIFDDCIGSFTFVGVALVITGALLMGLWYYTVAAGKRDSLFK